jgi:hypothetical protein
VPSAERFDAGYYRRFYGTNPVHDRRRIGHLAQGVFSLATWWQIPIRSVLDVGAGKGYWRDWLDEARPRVRYHGIDASDHACRRYGHEHADLATWRPSREFDLVICQSVLQYLDAAAATDAIATVGDAAARLLFVEVPTVADRDGIIDPQRSDMDVHWRTGRWYRTRLQERFVELGCGLWLSRSFDLPFFELDRC